MTFSPDPESGEIVAFSELFSLDSTGEKNRYVIGYGIVKTPENFDLFSKKGTKLYKAIANYIDILIINNTIIYTKIPISLSNNSQAIVPLSIKDTKPVGLTEEMAVVSVYLNQTTIKSNWNLCFIHTHHSSWQQLVIHNDNSGDIQQKVHRVSTKVDLIMQNRGNLFMIAEGKNSYQNLLNDPKIREAMKNAGNILDNLCNNIQHTKFNAFIYNLYTNPNKDPDYYVNQETNMVNGAIKLGHFSDIAFEKDFVIIIVYINKYCKTSFKLIYSDNFNNALKKQLDREFEQ